MLLKTNNKNMGKSLPNSIDTFYEGYYNISVNDTENANDVKSG